MSAQNISPESKTLVAMLERLPEISRKIAYEKAREAIELVVEDQIWDQKFKTNPKPLESIAARISKAKEIGDIVAF